MKRGGRYPREELLIEMTRDAMKGYAQAKATVDSITFPVVGIEETGSSTLTCHVLVWLCEAIRPFELLAKLA
jgi:hypothetical protein